MYLHLSPFSQSFAFILSWMMQYEFQLSCYFEQFTLWAHQDELQVFKSFEVSIEFLVLVQQLFAYFKLQTILAKFKAFLFTLHVVIILLIFYFPILLKHYSSTFEIYLFLLKFIWSNFVYQFQIMPSSIEDFTLKFRLFLKVLILFNLKFVHAHIQVIQFLFWIMTPLLLLQFYFAFPLITK